MRTGKLTDYGYNGYYELRTEMFIHFMAALNFINIRRPNLIVTIHEHYCYPH